MIEVMLKETRFNQVWVFFW